MQVTETIAAVATQVRDVLPGCAALGIDVDPVAALIDARAVDALKTLA